MISNLQVVGNTNNGVSIYGGSYLTLRNSTLEGNTLSGIEISTYYGTTANDDVSHIDLGTAGSHGGNIFQWWRTPAWRLTRERGSAWSSRRRGADADGGREPVRSDELRRRCGGNPRVQLELRRGVGLRNRGRGRRTRSTCELAGRHRSRGWQGWAPPRSSCHRPASHLH